MATWEFPQRVVHQLHLAVEFNSVEEFFRYNSLGFGVHCHIAICGFTVNYYVTWILLLVDNCVCDITLLGISFGLVLLLPLLLPCLAESRTLFGCCMIKVFRLVRKDLEPNASAVGRRSKGWWTG